MTPFNPRLVYRARVVFARAAVGSALHALERWAEVDTRAASAGAGGPGRSNLDLAAQCLDEIREGLKLSGGSGESGNLVPLTNGFVPVAVDDVRFLIETYGEDAANARKTAGTDAEREQAEVQAVALEAQAERLERMLSLFAGDNAGLRPDGRA